MNQYVSASMKAVILMMLCTAASQAENPGAASTGPATRPSHMSNSLNVYIGTYTKPKSQSQGIYLTRLDLETGSLPLQRWRARVQTPRSWRCTRASDTCMP